MNERTAHLGSRNDSPRVIEQGSSSGLAVLGKRALVALGITGAIYLGSNVYQESRQEAANRDLAAQIVKAGPKAVKEVENGTLSPTDFEVIKAPAGGYIGGVADVIGGNEHGGTQNIQDVLTAQTGSAGVVMKGQEIAVPTSFVDTGEQQRLVAQHDVVFPKP